MRPRKTKGQRQGLFSKLGDAARRLSEFLGSTDLLIDRDRSVDLDGSEGVEHGDASVHELGERLEYFLKGCPPLGEYSGA